jgi:hypothetical protein
MAYTQALGTSRSLVHSSVVARHHFNFVGVDEEGRLALSRYKGVNSFTQSSGDRMNLTWNESGKMLHRRQFLTIKSPPGTKFNLRYARWADGSEAWLDSRGLLHLVSSDRKLPQITLTLSNMPVAGWTSEDQTFGWNYFVDRPTATDTAVLDKLVREFVIRVQS